MPELNHQCRLSARPRGLPDDSVWELTEEEVPSEPPEGSFLVRIELLSLDPAMRGWMNDARSYIAPVQIGEVMRAGGIGEVVASRHPDFAEGDHVHGIFGAQEYAISDGRGTHRVDLDVAPAPTWLGTLGMTGMTAYFGLLDVGALAEGDTLVVSGAAGAVGSTVGQVARLKGAGRVVGIAGGSEKCAWLTEELGFDAAIDYKGEDVGRALREHAPDGIDVYFDNVGGDILDAALGRLARGARVVICGAISQYNATEAPRGPANYLSLLVNRARMEGFVVFDFAPRYSEAAHQLGEWMAAGKLHSREDVVEGGIAAFPATLLKLFAGENTGKLVLRV